MKLLILLALGCWPAVVCGDVCEVGVDECTKCLSIKGCSFFVTEEKASCHKLSEKIGKLRFKATKKSQCKTVDVLLEKKTTYSEVRNAHENSAFFINSTIISEPAHKSTEQQQFPHEKERTFLEATRPNETTQSAEKSAVLQSPNSHDGDNDAELAPVSQPTNSDGDNYAVAAIVPVSQPTNSDGDNYAVAAIAPVHQPPSSDGAHNDSVATTVIIADETDNISIPVAIQHVDSPPINNNEPSNETCVKLLFQYQEHELTTLFFDCTKENRLLKRVENSLCTSFRLLERTRQKNWIINADIIGVQYNETICSFLKAEKLYCKTML
ncbi:unnamed protein product [Orchesella dallaii]|uniref:Uncharacterized protein n=1 Tax=Orchesella dallaii TaxID=48710 RepID=A0ABP1RAP2_9HEXA